MDNSISQVNEVPMEDDASRFVLLCGGLIVSHHTLLEASLKRRTSTKNWWLETVVPHRPWNVAGVTGLDLSVSISNWKCGKRQRVIPSYASSPLFSFLYEIEEQRKDWCIMDGINLGSRGWIRKLLSSKLFLHFFLCLTLKSNFPIHHRDLPDYSFVLKYFLTSWRIFLLYSLVLWRQETVRKWGRRRRQWKRL